MTKLKFFLIAIATYFFASSICVAQKPKLVVGLVVDQMRWDYLYRYAQRYGKGGFKRLLNEGFSCQNVHLNYIPAFTACGHASIYTGSIPAIHGITGNEWLVQATGIKQYCTGDSTVQAVGSTSNSGQMSPRNLLTTTIGDELKLASNFKAKVIGIAIKDRGAILPAGHAADGVYWFNELTGEWITSTYYRKDLPTWVKAFNAQKLPAQLLANGWNTLYPIESYRQSTPYQNLYEGRYANEASVVFPHRFKPDGDFSIFKSTPFANTLTFDFAKKAIASEDLGKDEITDLLTISLSATDYIGHQFGPNSLEVEDTYLRLDNELARFFNYLDQTVGKGNYTFFLTADHGAAHNPSFLKDKKMPAGYWDAKALEHKLNNFLTAKYCASNLVKTFLNYQLYLNTSLLDKSQINFTQLKRDCISFINNEEGIAYAIDLDDVSQSTLPESLKVSITNGYYRKRSGVIQIIPEPGWFQLSADLTGTIHGAWNAYDSHIPLIFMGGGIKKGVLHKNVSVCDIAPTLASLLQIQEPNGNVGKVIVEALQLLLSRTK